MDDQRDEIFEQLTGLFSQSGQLWDIPESLTAHFEDEVILELAQEYRKLGPVASADGHAAICSAGPPGAGKLGALMAATLSGYRKIDPDVAKDLVLEEALSTGFWTIDSPIFLLTGTRLVLGRSHGMSMTLRIEL